MIDLVKTSAHGPAAGDAKTRAVDTGMAMVLLCLIMGFVRQKTGWFAAATVLLVINMTWPRFFAPASKVWFGLSGLLGSAMSRVILSLAFFLVVTPVALIRRRMGKDSLKLTQFKAGQGSVFITRDKPFTAADLTTPF